MTALMQNPHLTPPSDVDDYVNYYRLFFEETIQALLGNRKRHQAMAQLHFDDVYFDDTASEEKYALPVAEVSPVALSPPRAYGGGEGVALSPPKTTTRTAPPKIIVRASRSRNVRLEREKKILDLLKRAGKENWDGEGARAISERIANIAQKIVTEFPSDIEEPDISASPRGDIDFDWVVKEDVMLTISVVSSGKIVFALMLGDFHLSGTKETWEGTLPDFFDCCFEHLRRA